MSIASQSDPFSNYNSLWRRSGPSWASSGGAPSGVTRASNGKYYVARGGKIYCGSTVVKDMLWSGVNAAAYGDWFYWMHVSLYSYGANTATLSFVIRAYNVVSGSAVTLSSQQFAISTAGLSYTWDYTSLLTGSSRCSIDMKNGRGFAVAAAMQIFSTLYTPGGPDPGDPYTIYRTASGYAGGTFNLGTTTTSPTFIAASAHGSVGGTTDAYHTIQSCAVYGDVGFYSLGYYTGAAPSYTLSTYKRWKLTDLSTPTDVAMTDSATADYAVGPGLHVKGLSSSIPYTYDEADSWALTGGGVGLYAFMGEDATNWYVMSATWIFALPKAGGTVTRYGFYLSPATTFYCDKSFVDWGYAVGGDTYIPPRQIFSKSVTGYGWAELVIPMIGVD